jgi:hypothetical protein
MEDAALRNSYQALTESKTLVRAVVAHHTYKHQHQPWVLVEMAALEL